MKTRSETDDTFDRRVPKLVRRLGKSFGITALAFLLSFIFVAPFVAVTSYFFSTPERNDFTVVDLYNMVADNRAVSHLDDNVIVVNIDNCGRNEIADILNVVSLAGAGSVGLDVLFEDERAGDAYLLDAIRHSRKLVMPISVRSDSSATADGRFHIDMRSYFCHPDDGKFNALDGDTIGGDTRYAAASMPSKYEGGMVREMQTSFILGETDTVLSFPVELARVTDPEAYGKLRSRNRLLENITYHSRRFALLEPEELLANPDTVSGRIVLIGALHERGDLHPTPVDAVMPGVLIHAHSLATILDNAYMTAIPEWLNILIGFAVCFLVVFTHVTIESGAKGLILRLLQLALLWLIIQVGYWFFVSKDIVIDMSYALLMLAFGLFACDIWNGIAALTADLRKSGLSDRIKNLTNRRP